MQRSISSSKQSQCLDIFVKNMKGLLHVSAITTFRMRTGISVEWVQSWVILNIASTGTKSKPKFGAGHEGLQAASLLVQAGYNHDLKSGEDAEMQKAMT